MLIVARWIDYGFEFARGRASIVEPICLLILGVLFDQRDECKQRLFALVQEIPRGDAGVDRPRLSESQFRGGDCLGAHGEVAADERVCNRLVPAGTPETVPRPIGGIAQGACTRGQDFVENRGLLRAIDLGGDGGTLIGEAVAFPLPDRS